MMTLVHLREELSVLQLQTGPKNVETESLNHRLTKTTLEYHLHQ